MLSDAERAALVARLRKGRAGGLTGITRRPPTVDRLPLSYGQEQLWFLDQLAPGLDTYNIAGRLRLTGALDAAALARALDALVERHEILRTRLVSRNGVPLQVIDPPTTGNLALTDLAGLDADVREAELQRLSSEEAERPFVLDRGPLLRTRLVKLADDSHYLLIAVHHSVFDGWSFDVFARELLSLYDGARTGAGTTLPELPIQFADYALWEREHLQGSVLEELVGYWQQTLAGVPSLQLPTDRPRPVVQTYEGGVEAVTLEPELRDRLSALSRSGGTTLFVTLLAAFQVLLHRFSGQDDVVVGTVSANRTRTELAPLIGYLVNTLAIRSDLSGDPSFEDLQERVKVATLEAYAHQELPFAKLVEVLQVHRDPGRHPIFQVGFNLAESYESELTSGGLSVGQEAYQNTAAKFDLLLNVEDHAGGLTLSAGYALALFDAETVRRLLEHFQVLLSAVVADPAQRLSRLPLLSPAQRHRELVEWNSSATDLPRGCLHERFDVQVRATPDAVAVRLGHQSLTYRELGARSNQVARKLRELGAGPEALIGVCMQRSVDRVVALLGILKSGAGYVPLDPDYPVDRLAFMMSDAGMRIVVTDETSRPSVPHLADVVVSLDGDRAAIDALDERDPGYPADPATVAYVIYTSGSTGRPKGVVVEHRQAVNFATGQIRVWGLGPGDRMLQFAPLNFDISVLDHFGALLSGATMVLGPAETMQSPPRLAELIRAERVTFVCMPPAVLNLLADEQFPDLRIVIAGGEAFSAALVHSWARPGVRFVNAYGPTEVTVGATVQVCVDDGNPPPIGRPLPNYTAYVLDAQLQPVPVGVTGELHLGGDSVARGYLNRPELTRERFVPDPFAPRPGARLYKTGDMARRMPDGNLQFLGRIDDQVKIRGLRIELGEIETVLAQHRDVLQAAVAVSPDRTGQPQLVGYARVEPNRPKPDPAELRLHLADALPAYMVPAHVLVLDTFPLSPNGKVDRARLPAPEPAAGGTEHRPPRTLVEAVLVDTYATLLNLDAVGIDDSFFDLGGNSLASMQLVTGLREELAVDLDVSAIFLAPTPAQLASVLRDKHGLNDSSLDEDAAGGLDPLTAAGPPAEPPSGGPLIRLSDGSGTTPLHLVHAIGGTVYAYAVLARELADRYAVWGIEATGLREGERPAASLSEMVTRYVEGIRTTQPHGPYRVGGWSFGGLVALEIASRLRAEGDRVEFVALLDTPLNIHDSLEQSEAELAGFFVADIAWSLGPDALQPPDPATHGATEQLRWLSDHVSAGSDVPGAEDQIRRRFDVYQAHLRLIAGYVPQSIDVPVTVVGASESADNADEWARTLGGSVHAVRVPGNHYSFLQAPGVQDVAAALRDLSRTPDGSP